MTPKAMHNPIIVALDVESALAARDMVAKIGPHVNFYKVGLELYAAAGMGIVDQLLAEGKLTRDAEASALNMQLTRWRDSRAADEAFVAGSGDALSTWRQP